MIAVAVGAATLQLQSRTHPNPSLLSGVPMPASAPGTSVTRRDFLARTGATAAVLAAAPLLGGAGVAPAESGHGVAPPAPAVKKYPIGIEMFAVRKEQQKDLPGTLRTLKGFGYEAVEFFAPYLGWTLPHAKDVRVMLDDLGLRCYSTHNSIASLTPGDMMTKAIEVNQILGARHIVLASPPFNTATSDEWKRLCAQLTAASDVLLSAWTAGRPAQP